MHQFVRAAAVALVCVWAGHAWANSAASVKIVGTRVTLTALKDGLEPGAGDYAPAYYESGGACLTGYGCLVRSIPTSPADDRTKEAFHIVESFGEAATSGDDYAHGWAAAMPHEMHFSAGASYLQGVGVEPWTHFVLEIDVELLATGESASSWIEYQFLDQSQRISITESSGAQGIHTVSFTFSNHSDQFLQGRKYVSLGAIGATGITPVPEAPTAMLLLAGLAGLISRRARSARAGMPA